MGAVDLGHRRKTDRQPAWQRWDGVVGTDDRAAVQQELVLDSPLHPDCLGQDSQDGLRDRAQGQDSGSGLRDKAQGQDLGAGLTGFRDKAQG